MNGILAAIAGAFLNKKRVIGWLAAVGLVVGAAAAGLPAQEFKDAVCGAPIIQPDTK
jgi:hypothetical protein